MNAWVAGVAQVPVRRKLARSLRETAFSVGRAALADAGLELRDVDALVVGPAGLGGKPSFMWACDLGAYLGLCPASLGLVECGGATGAQAVKVAALEVACGRARVALVIGLDYRSIDDLGDDLAHYVRNAVVAQVNLYGPYAAVYGLGAPIPYYAMSSQRYLHEHGLAPRALGEIAAALRRHAGRNPDAQYREPLDADAALAAPMVAPPLTLPMCAPMSAGAAACVIVGDGVARATRRPVRVRALGEHHDASHFAPARPPITRFCAVELAARRAFSAGGCAPGDVDVAEVYGVFAGTEAMVLEDLGLFARGAAARALAEGAAEHVDPSGGRLSLGHPAGATPLYALAEVVRQLRGEAGPTQVAGASLGLVHAEHGMLNGALVALLEPVTPGGAA